MKSREYLFHYWALQMKLQNVKESLVHISCISFDSSGSLLYNKLIESSPLVPMYFTHQRLLIFKTSTLLLKWYISWKKIQNQRWAITMSRFGGFCQKRTSSCISWYGNSRWSWLHHKLAKGITNSQLLYGIHSNSNDPYNVTFSKVIQICSKNNKAFKCRTFFSTDLFHWYTDMTGVL